MRHLGKRSAARLLLSASLACAWGELAVADAQVLFPAASGVPRPVQDFTWRVIETHCRFQPYERAQRSFWAYDVRVRSIEGGTVYRIAVVADLTWRKREPSAFIEMTLVDEGRLRLDALTLSFILCAP